LHGIDNLDQIIHGKINVFNLWKETVDINLGVNDEKAGEYAIKSFVAATKALKEGLVDGCYSSINKYNIQSEFKFPGQLILDQELEGDACIVVQDDFTSGFNIDHIQ
jgi:4-hydroxythreonine-4-phosphate dehydrogenase